DGTVEEIAVGLRHVQPERVEMRRHDAPSKLQARYGDEVAAELSGAVFHGPGHGHGTSLQGAKELGGIVKRFARSRCFPRNTPIGHWRGSRAISTGRAILVTMRRQPRPTVPRCSPPDPNLQRG